MVFGDVWKASLLRFHCKIFANNNQHLHTYIICDACNSDMVATISGQEVAYLPGALSKDRAPGVRGFRLREPQGALHVQATAGMYHGYWNWSVANQV